MSSGLLLCFTHARAEALMRRPRHSVARHHLSLALRNGALPQRKEKTILIVVSFLFPWYIRTQLSFGLLCFPIARAEAVRKRPRYSIARHHLSLALEKWCPLPNKRKIYVDCSLFLLVFPWLRQGAEKGAVPHRVV